jgi:hypothetical protein
MCIGELSIDRPLFDFRLFLSRLCHAFHMRTDTCRIATVSVYYLSLVGRPAIDLD